MARKPRIHLTGGLYHVILRGNGGQPVFLTDEDLLAVAKGCPGQQRLRNLSPESFRMLLGAAVSTAFYCKF
jgi:hypothetical protein